VMIKHQTLKKLNEMMMLMEVMEIMQKLKMIPQIHLSNLAGNTSKKSNKKFRIADVEDDDDRSESCKSDNSHFSQTSSIEPQGQSELLQFSQLSTLNGEECSSATAIDLSIKKHKQTKTKEGNQIKGKDMAMLVFNPCIMVFSPLFNVRMLTLTILMRRHTRNCNELPESSQRSPRELPEISQRALSLQANYSSLELIVNMFCM
jgi:hypothetical protein